MRWHAATLLLLGSAVAGAQDDGTANASGDVELDVKPVLCILDRRTPACDMDFLIAWQSALTGSYCLFSHFAESPVRCWREALTGEHRESHTVDASFQYWLTGTGGDEPVAAVTVEVMTTETDDRRRRRRTRHVWDIL